MATEKTRVIPKKNYYLATLLFVGAILLTLYIFKWYQVFEAEKINQSYLIKTKTITNEINSLDEISDVFSEAPNEYFLYISYTKDENVYNMEKNLRKVIRKYDLQDHIYYLNVDSIRQNPEYLEELNAALNLQDEKVSSIPTIIYYKDHAPVDGGIIKKENNALMQADDFEQLIEIMEIGEE